MKKAEEFARPPERPGLKKWFAELPPKFWIALKDFENYAEHQRNAEYGMADYLRKGDIFCNGIAHSRFYRIATPSRPTHYCLLGHAMVNEYQQQGYCRPLTLPELLKIIPHMTKLIWHIDGQFALRDMLCRIPAMPPLGTPDKQTIISKFWL